MQYIYDQFVNRRTANGRIFLVNARMPFEQFLWCFQAEQPLFLVSQLEDGRVAIVPNAMCIPWNLLQSGYWPQDLLPSGFEYVTIKQGTYPVIVSAHPLPSFEEWYRSFGRCVESFATQSLASFLSASREFLPVRFEGRERRETAMEAWTPRAETLPA